MAVGKNKGLNKGGPRGKKGGVKRRIVDPFVKKEWYDLIAPATFRERLFGQTLVTKSAGTKIASDSLKGRVFEVNLADLNGDEEQSYRKVKLRCEDVRGRQLLLNFYGMDLTTEKAKSLVRKWQSLIECSVDVVVDGYSLRIFAIAFTRKRPGQIKRTCYAKASQERQIRKCMTDVILKETKDVSLKQLVTKLMSEAISKEIESATKSIFPLQNVYIRKVKMTKQQKPDHAKLLEMHGGSFDTSDLGKPVEKKEPTDEEVEEGAEVAEGEEEEIAE